MTRRLAIATALFVIAAACTTGSNDTTTTAPSETAPQATAPTATEAAPVTGPATITATDQGGDGTIVIIDSVDLPTRGYVAVHADADGSPGPVVGVSDLLPAGVSNDVEIELSTPLADEAALFPMLHVDANDNGVYEFAPPDNVVDIPATGADGTVAVTKITVTPESAAATVEPNGEVVEIAISGFAFEPAELTVSLGTTIVWTNQDGVGHTATNAGGAFNSGVLGLDGSFEVVLDTPGVYEYVCTIHPAMQATITVEG